jgi:hypothetical protein
MPIRSSQPKPDLTKKLILLYGAPGIGKSTMAAQIPNATFLATEKGLEELDVANRWETEDGRYVIQSWHELLHATEEAIQAGSKTIIIDTLGNACWLAERHICDKYNENYISDGKLGYGKGTRLVVNEIKRYLTKLTGMGIGVVLIAHGTSKVIETRTGEITKQIPLIPGDNKREELYNAILATADLIGYADQESITREDRVEIHQVLRLRSEPTFEAKDRSGRLPPLLPLKWPALVKAYTANTKPQSQPQTNAAQKTSKNVQNDSKKTVATS